MKNTIEKLGALTLISVVAETAFKISLCQWQADPPSFHDFQRKEGGAPSAFYPPRGVAFSGVEVANCPELFSTTHTSVSLFLVELVGSTLCEDSQP